MQDLEIMFMEKDGRNIEAARRLYTEVFEDTASFVDYFFEREVPDTGTKILAGYIDGELAAEMFLREKRLVFRGKRLRGCYIYGVAVIPRYRGRGYMKRLMAYAVDYCRAHGTDIIYLIPVDENIYKGCGFVTVRDGERIAVDTADSRGCTGGKRYNMLALNGTNDIDVGALLRAAAEFAANAVRESRDIRQEYNTDYFRRRLWQAEAENTAIYVLTYTDRSLETDGIDAIAAVIMTSRDTGGGVYISEVICGGGTHNEKNEYAAALLKEHPEICPYIRVYPVMVHASCRGIGDMGVNDEV